MSDEQQTTTVPEAVYAALGLALHLDAVTRAEVRLIAALDVSPGVRAAAMDVLDD